MLGKSDKLFMIYFYLHIVVQFQYERKIEEVSQQADMNSKYPVNTNKAIN